MPVQKESNCHYTQLARSCILFENHHYQDWQMWYHYILPTLVCKSPRLGMVICDFSLFVQIILFTCLIDCTLFSLGQVIRLFMSKLRSGFVCVAIQFSFSFSCLTLVTSLSLECTSLSNHQYFYESVGTELIFSLLINDLLTTSLVLRLLVIISLEEAPSKFGDLLFKTIAMLQFLSNTN